MLTLENFRWNILKICSIFLVFVMKAVDQHWILCFCCVFVFLISAILLFQSKAGQNHYHSRGRGETGGTSYYTVQPTGTSQSWNHRLQLSFTPHDDYLYSRYCWPPASLCNSGLLSILYHLLYLFFQAAVFYNNNKKRKKNLWSVTGGCRFFSQRVHEKKTQLYLIISSCMSSSQIGTT